MRKTKENIKPPHSDDRDMNPVGLETEREQRYEEFNGETSTEGVGVGFDEGPDSEDDDVNSADGPVSGNSSQPPEKLETTEREWRESEKTVNKKPQEVREGAKGNHTAARSSKAL